MWIRGGWTEEHTCSGALRKHLGHLSIDCSDKFIESEITLCYINISRRVLLYYKCWVTASAGCFHKPFLCVGGQTKLVTQNLSRFFRTSGGRVFLCFSFWIELNWLKTITQTAATCCLSDALCDYLEGSAWSKWGFWFHKWQTKVLFSSALLTFQL